MQKLINPIVKQLEQWILKDAWLENLTAQYSRIGDAVCFEPDQFPWVANLEANWHVIRQELEQVMQSVDQLPNYQDISKRQSRIANDDLWKTFFFYAFGFKATKNCERCPQTAQLLDDIPGLKVAFFSILAPGKHIPKHRGKHKGVIRYHLGLIVPAAKDRCWIEIADQTRYWEEGKSLIFDDTFDHEVWNNTDEYRAVLFLDIVRPLRFPLSLVNWLINQLIAASPIIQEAKVNHEQWENQLDEAVENAVDG